MPKKSSPRRWVAGWKACCKQRRDVLSGIVNGVDYREWDPATDPHLPANLRPDDCQAGKAVCKAALQTELGLPISAANVRWWPSSAGWSSKKGSTCWSRRFATGCNRTTCNGSSWAPATPTYQEQFAMLAQRFPQKVATRLEFSNALAHRIEAGADMFVMPSRYEPCGLNQLYSLKYGTVPIVRATGGLVGHDHEFRRAHAGQRHGQRLQLWRI